VRVDAEKVSNSLRWTLSGRLALQSLKKVKAARRLVGCGGSGCRKQPPKAPFSAPNHRDRDLCGWPPLVKGPGFEDSCCETSH
jgi:hypothetical protein